jgi:hypothetical protein
VHAGSVNHARAGAAGELSDNQIGDQDGPASIEVARVETLLSAVNDMMSSLRRVSSQLDQEVRAVLGAAGPAAVGGAPASGITALRTENEQLRAALEGRGVIERAKGVLMAKSGCSEAEAFTMLATLSRQQERKVRAVAIDVLAEFDATEDVAGRTEPGVTSLHHRKAVATTAELHSNNTATEHL